VSSTFELPKAFSKIDLCCVVVCMCSEKQKRERTTRIEPFFEQNKKAQEKYQSKKQKCLQGTIFKF